MLDPDLDTAVHTLAWRNDDGDDGRACDREVSLSPEHDAYEWGYLYRFAVTSAMPGGRP